MATTESKRKQIVNRYLEAHNLYQHTEKKLVLQQIESCMLNEDYEGAETQLETLKTKAELLEKLSQTLRGKSVYRTLRKMLNGTLENNFEGIKGMTSLMTHIIIECEMGNMEYLPILFDTNDTVQILISKLKK